MSFMTGRLPHRLSIWDNYGLLPSAIPIFAHALEHGGYEAVLCGRMHFLGYDQRHGFKSRIFPEVSNYAAGLLYDTDGWQPSAIEKSGPGRNHYLLYDRLCVQAAENWLRKRVARKEDKPFCLVVGLTGPHCPFVCPEKLFWKYFRQVDVPVYSADYFHRTHPFLRRYRKICGIEDLSEAEIRRARAAYYGMVEYDDRLIGHLVDRTSFLNLLLGERDKREVRAELCDRQLRVGPAMMLREGAKSAFIITANSLNFSI